MRAIEKWSNRHMAEQPVFGSFACEFFLEEMTVKATDAQLRRLRLAGEGKGSSVVVLRVKGKRGADQGMLIAA
jgi:hypothetical protein